MSARNDLIGHRCCCCGGELSHMAEGLETAGRFPDVMYLGTRWRRRCLKERRDR